MDDARSRRARQLLHQAGRLLRELKHAMEAGNFTRDDLHMKRYNDLIAAASQLFYDDPVLNGQLVKMPDANVQMFIPPHGLLPFNDMPRDLPTVRTEEHLTRLINRLEFVMGEGPIESSRDLIWPAGLWEALHPTVSAVAKDRFEDGYLADAVESALKKVNNRVKAHVKKQTGQERDGADLMNFAFSPKRPVIILADLEPQPA